MARFSLRAAANNAAARDSGRKASEPNYVNIPSVLAHAMEFAKGVTVAEIAADMGSLIPSRREVPPNRMRWLKASNPANPERYRQALVYPKICGTGPQQSSDD